MKESLRRHTNLLLHNLEKRNSKKLVMKLKLTTQHFGRILREEGYGKT